MIKVTVGDVVYHVEMSFDPSTVVTFAAIYANNRWTTNCRLTSDLTLIDFDTELDAEVSGALEEAIAESFARGAGAEFDPTAR